MDRFGRPVTPAENVLVVLAHQDDETGILTRIAYETCRGNAVWCVYLTDGGRNADPAIRDAESLQVLVRFGVPRERVAFLSVGGARIADGRLMHHLDGARRALAAWIETAGAVFARVYTIDWEGGHADHDACHLVALAAARDAAIADVWTFTLYNGYGAPKGFFRVLSFVPATQPLARRKLRLRDAWSAARAIFAYRSQRRTWLALGPAWLTKTLLLREERLRRADPGRLRELPHRGAPLYETLFKVDPRDMLEASAALRRELLEPAQQPGSPGPA